jgi:asparaginyl-tRNA synthetase
LLYVLEDHIEKIKKLNDKKFVRISYTQALEILNSLDDSFNLKFGDNINKNQEKLLVDHFEETPVFVVNYPRQSRPFYMRHSLDNDKTVDNFDLLAPDVGEIVGGSLREYRLPLIKSSMKENGIDFNNYKDYLETKSIGAMRMGGFGVGIERLLQFILNIDNIKDTSAFPRSIYYCKM